MKANIGLDATGSYVSYVCLTVAPVISSSTVPLISLARAKEMKSRPPALDLSEANRSLATTANAGYIISSDGGAVKSTKGRFDEPKTPPLPTPPLAKNENTVKGNFELEMEKALGKVGKADTKTPESEKKPPLLELSIPIGLQ